MTRESDPLTGFAPDNPALKQLVKAQLRTLAKSNDPRFRRIATDILAGRRSIWNLPEEGFSDALDSMTQQLHALNDEQQQELIEQARQWADQHRDEPEHPR